MAGIAAGACLVGMSGATGLFELWTIALAGVPLAAALGLAFRWSRDLRVPRLPVRLATIIVLFPLATWGLLVPIGYFLGELEVVVNPAIVRTGQVGRLPFLAGMVVAGVAMASVVTLSFRDLFARRASIVWCASALSAAIGAVSGHYWYLFGLPDGVSTSLLVWCSVWGLSLGWGIGARGQAPA